MTGDFHVVATCCGSERRLQVVLAHSGDKMLDLGIVVNALAVRHTKQASSNKQTSAFHFLSRLSLWVEIKKREEIQLQNNCEELN